MRRRPDRSELRAATTVPFSTRNRTILEQIQILAEGGPECSRASPKSCVEQDWILDCIAARTFDQNGLAPRRSDWILDCIAAGSFDQNVQTPYFDEVTDNATRLIFEQPVATSDRDNVLNEKDAALCSNSVWPAYHDNSCLVGFAAKLKENTHQAFRAARFSE